ncbi:MAG: TRZ/ATZ family hydrolase [Gammaproteobacteria bacterium]|nr:TRZ/ATZ family hydrolase [Gammaproteobacteria bacterium]
MEQADLVIAAKWVAPVRPAGEVLDDHSVVVNNGRIAAILPTDKVGKRYTARETVDLGHHLLIPGLVNAHTHAAMSLLRGLADDLPLMEWLKEHIWPAEQHWLGPDFVRDGSELAIAEMLRGGTTCFNDMYLFPDATARVASRAGIRASIGLVMFDFPTPWAETPAEYIRKGLALRDEFKSDALLSFCFAPHAPYTVSDENLAKVQQLADELDLPVHMHVHETAQEVTDAVHSSGQRPLARIDELGMLNPGFMAVHMTQLDDDEIARVAETGASVVHCPESNLKLASGFCPVKKLRDAGVNVALGTDGAASNNDLDMIGEMRSAALLAKGAANNPVALSAESALEIATLGGARALGLEEHIGSIEVGKWADLVAVDLDRIETTPVYNPVSQLVYSASRDQVSHVWVAGQARVTDGRLLHVNSTKLKQRANEWRDRIAADGASK